MGLGWDKSTPTMNIGHGEIMLRCEGVAVGGVVVVVEFLSIVDPIRNPPLTSHGHMTCPLGNDPPGLPNSAHNRHWIEEWTETK